MQSGTDRLTALKWMRRIVKGNSTVGRWESPSWFYVQEPQMSKARASNSPYLRDALCGAARQ